MGCVTSGIQSQSFLGIQSVKMENIISSLLNIKELMEDTLQRFDVVQQHLDDFRASHDKMHQIFQLSLDELEDQICEIQEEDAVAVEEDEAKGKIKSAQLTLSDVPKNPKPFPSFSDLPVRTSCHSLHLRNYFSFFSFRSIVPSTNDTVTVKEEDLAIRWKFDPGGIHIQSLDSSPSPQNNSHTIFQPVDLSYSHFSASIHTSLMIDWKWIDKGCSRWRWEQNTKRRVQMVTPKIIKMSLVADNSKSLAICHDNDIVCIFVVHWHQIEFIVSRIGLVQIASSFKTKCQTQHSKQPIKSFPKFTINGFSNNTLEEKGEQPVSSDEEEFEGMIQADFAFFNPRANDFQGVKTWLQTYPDHTAYYRGRFDLDQEDMTRPPEHGEIAKLSQLRQQDVVALASGYLRLDQLLLFHKRGSEHAGKRAHVQILTAARDVWDGFFVQTWTEGMAPQMFDKIIEQNLMLIFQLSSSIFVSLVSRFRAGFKAENQMASGRKQWILGSQNDGASAANTNAFGDSLSRSSTPGLQRVIRAPSSCSPPAVDEYHKEDTLSLRNLSLLLSSLYVIGVCSSRLICDFLIMWSKRLIEIDIITLLLKIPFLDEEVAPNSFPRKMGHVDGYNPRSSRKEPTLSLPLISSTNEGTANESLDQHEGPNSMVFATQFFINFATNQPNVAGLILAPQLLNFLVDMNLAPQLLDFFPLRGVFWPFDRGREITSVEMNCDGLDTIKILMNPSYEVQVAAPCDYLAFTPLLTDITYGSKCHFAIVGDGPSSLEFSTELHGEFVSVHLQNMGIDEHALKAFTFFEKRNNRTSSGSKWVCKLDGLLNYQALVVAWATYQDVSPVWLDQYLLGYAATHIDGVLVVEREVLVGIKKIFVFDPGGGTIMSAPCGQGASMGDGLSQSKNSIHGSGASLGLLLYYLFSFSFMLCKEVGQSSWAVSLLFLLSSPLVISFWSCLSKLKPFRDVWEYSSIYVHCSY